MRAVWIKKGHFSAKLWQFDHETHEKMSESSKISKSAQNKPWASKKGKSYNSLNQFPNMKDRKNKLEI